MVVADERGMGGRLIVELERYNMNRRLYNARSTIDTGLNARKGVLTRGQSPKAWVGGYKPPPGSDTARSKSANPGRPSSAPPRRAVGTSGRALFQEMKDWAEVKETYRRVSNVSLKGHKNSGKMQQAPATLDLAKKLSENRQRRLAQTDRTLSEHKKNIHHMNRRIQESYSLHERKKNDFDTAIHPSYILRREKKPDHTISSTFHRLLPGGGTTKGRPAGTQDIRSSRDVRASHDGRPAKPRPATAGSRRAAGGRAGERGPVGGGGAKVFTKSPARGGSDGAGGRPTGLSSDDAYVMYKDSLMNRIVSERIYEEKRLIKLFKETLRTCPEEDLGVVRDVVARLKLDLDVEDF